MEKEELEEGVLEEEESEEDESEEELEEEEESEEGEESEEEEESETPTSTWKSYRIGMGGWPWLAMILFSHTYE